MTTARPGRKADRITHDLQLNGKIDIEAGLDQYMYDKNFLQSEAAWNDVRNKILGISADDSSGSDDSSSDSEEGSTGDDEGSDSDDEDDDLPQTMTLTDETSQNIGFELCRSG